MTTSLATFCDKHNILWFPISLTITDNKKKELNVIHHPLYNGRPKMTDFKELDISIIKQRQQLLKDASWNKILNKIAIDTSSVYHIDIDTPDYDEGFDEIASISPYFKSMTKEYGKHILIKANDFQPESNRIQFNNKGVELLSGVWSYAPLEIFNADKDILELQNIKEMLVLKEQPKEKKIKKIIVANDETDNESETTETNENMTDIEYLLMECIKSNLCETGTQPSWSNVGQAIKNELQDEGVILFVDWTKKYGSENKKAEAFTHYTKYLKYTPLKNKKRLSIASLHYWAKQANKSAYELRFKQTQEEIETPFEKMCKEFEKSHLKIVNKGFFIKEFENRIMTLTESDLRVAYSHLVYEKEVESKNGNKMVTKSFINDWLRENPLQRRKDDMDMFPTGLKCPDNYYNTWRPFDMELITEYTENKEALEIILNHIKILCGNDEEVTEYFIKWIAQMIQYPAIKTICPTLISKEGAGKGTLMCLFNKMLGNEKVFETCDPSRDIWGDFNAQMADSFLINLNELSKKDTIDAEGKIKGLISDRKLTINNKGVKKYQINSFHRFIITTNKEEPIVTKDGDRRNIIIRSSDEKCGDKEYFSNLYKLLDDVNIIKTCYEYFKSIPDMDKFGHLKTPETEYHKELKELSKSPIESWLEYFASKNQDRDYIELKSQSIYEKFNDWAIENGLEYKIDALKLMVRISRLKIDGIEKRKSDGIMITRFDIEKMKKHYGIGCLL